MPCTSCIEARRKLLAARTAREAAAALAAAVRINVDKATGKPEQPNSEEAADGQSRA